MNESGNGAVERIHFDKHDQQYHSYYAAQHLVRYSAVRELVAGKRVLDIACGEGYGTRLCADWGAKNVVGVDNSPDALSVAKSIFNTDKCRFVLGDAEQADDLFDKGQKFDVIISLETIEHLKSPERFLLAIKKLRAKNGVVAISCPNDFAYVGDAQSNSFHLQKYSFDRFKFETEKHLGAASTWLLGAPVTGECNLEVGNEFATDDKADWISIISPGNVSNAFQLAASRDMLLTSENCSHYLGIWGAKVSTNVVFASQTVPIFLEPWKALDWFKQQNASLVKKNTSLMKENEDFTSERARLVEEVQRLRQKALNTASSMDWYKSKLKKKTETIERMENKLERSLVITVPKKIWKMIFHSKS
jgi:2-polyprenyl-3-methyl-5-hydroxy-6-metoxy-1,4-benzoquinol methylase